MPQAAVTKALNALTWRTVHETWLSQVDTPEGLAPDCPSGYKDMITLLITESGRTPAARPATPPPGAATAVGVCVYTDDPSLGTTPTVGTFRPVAR